MFKRQHQKYKVFNKVHSFSICEQLKFYLTLTTILINYFKVDARISISFWNPCHLYLAEQDGIRSQKVLTKLNKDKDGS